MKLLFLTCRLPSLCVLTWPLLCTGLETERERGRASEHTGVSSSSHKDTNLIELRFHPYDFTQPLLPSDKPHVQTKSHWGLGIQFSQYHKPSILFHKEVSFWWDLEISKNKTKQNKKGDLPPSSRVKLVLRLSPTDVKSMRPEMLMAHSTVLI